MSSTNGSPSASKSAPPDPSIVTATIARLRAEHEVAETATSRALLLHELGVLEEAMGDEAAAARDQLGAVNAEPDFAEPLERLIAIIERRQSYKNLGKLLERLVRIAEEPAERARALVEQGLYKADHQQDLDGARELLEEAAAEQPEDAFVWFAMELVAGRQESSALRSRALAARAELTQHEPWRALLLVTLAQLLGAEGEVDSAFNALDQAIGLKTPATYTALATLANLATEHQRHSVLADTLNTQATLILRSIDDPKSGDAVGVPRRDRSAAHAADAWLRASYALREQGNLVGAVETLDQALEQLPQAPALLHARTAAADTLGDTPTAARLAQRQLDTGVGGPYAAGLWLRVAEGAAVQGDITAALEAVERALRADPGSIPARALELDFLTATQDAPALAGALESLAEQFEADDAKASAFLLAADVWARRAKNAQAARAALSQAGMYGAGPGTVARVARMLATLTDDATWYDEATRRLLAAGATEAERPSLWVELARNRLQRGDLEGVAKVLESLASAPGGEWLGSSLTAFALPLVATLDNTRASTALQELSRLESDPSAARAWQLAVARRTLAANPSGAEELLRTLHETDGADIVTATQLATLYRQRSQPLEAALVLSTCAATIEEPQLAAAMQIEAGVLHWHGGDRDAAVNCFNIACAHAPEAGEQILKWALRAVAPDDLAARRRALEASADDGDAGLTHLERFALEAGPGGDPEDARAALESLTDDAHPDLVAAAVLSRSVWGREPADRAIQEHALAELETRSPAAAALARSAIFQLQLEDGAEPAELEQSAARWSEVDDSAAAALEWVGAAVALGDPAQEASAKRALAKRLGGDASLAVEASARLVALLGGDDRQPLLRSNHPAARLTNLELAPPAGDPRRRATALGNLGDVLGDETATMAAALAGWNQLAAGDAAGAMMMFRSVIEALPDELVGWEGLRAAAEQVGDRSAVAEACAALGDVSRNDAMGAEFWEHAGLILLDELQDPARAELAFGRAVERDISRGVAFDKLFRMVRARKDGPRLLDLISTRLEVAEDPDELAKLFWERARVLRGDNRIDEALAALENVTMLEPDHVGALALSGEVYIKRGKFAEAAEKLARLAQLDEAPRQQRLMSGVAAVDIFENKLDQVDRALEVLLGLHRDGLSTLPVRERLARTAARVGAWESATTVLEELMHQRDTSEGRIEAARLALAIYRDRLAAPDQAEAAAEKLLSEAPGDGEALDLVLGGHFSGAATEQLLGAGLEAIVEELGEDPLQAEQIDRLARVAAVLEEAPLRQACLGALVAVGEGTPEIDAELTVLDQRVARLPQIAIDESALPDLCDPEDGGPIGSLMQLVAPTLAEALGPNLQALGVTRRDRVDPSAGLPIRNEVSAWAGALGIDFDLYVGGKDDQGVYGIATDRRALVVGKAISAPLQPHARAAVARELFALRRGTIILRHRDPTDVAAIVVAVCNIAGHPLASPHYAMLDEFQRLIARALPRKVKRALPEVAAQVVADQQDPLAWVAAATGSLDRMAAVAAGDVSRVLASNPQSRGQLGASIEAQERAARLLAFVLSPTYLELREQLGMGVR